MISLGSLMGNSVKLGKMDVKLGQVVSNPYARAFAPQVNEGEEGSDYEVSMAAKQLDDIIKSATELKAKMGQKEFNVAAWIQDHISKSQDYINQANYGFDKNESVVAEGKNWAKLMAGIKKGSQSGPWTIVVSRNKKVVYQQIVKVKDAIPANVEHMKSTSALKGDIYAIEDNHGQVVYAEKI